jgi:hypothetical protein
MKLEIKKSSKANGRKRLTVCNYGYFLTKGKWEAIVINLRPLPYTFWIWRKAIYRNEWPVKCG